MENGLPFQKATKVRKDLSKEALLSSVRELVPPSLPAFRFQISVFSSQIWPRGLLVLWSGGPAWLEACSKCQALWLPDLPLGSRVIKPCGCLFCFYVSPVSAPRSVTRWLGDSRPQVRRQTSHVRGRRGSKVDSPRRSQAAAAVGVIRVIRALF